MREYDPAAGLNIGPIDVDFGRTQHYLPTWGARLTAGGAVLVYSADSGPTPALVELAREADLFLCEATLLTRDEEEAVPGHLTAAEAGTIAQAAGARRLLLTHLWPELGLPALLAAARTTFSGPVGLAVAGETHLVEPASLAGPIA
jgi:ribonuclease BN (tRNA processing enzyme)